MTKYIMAGTKCRNRDDKWDKIIAKYERKNIPVVARERVELTGCCDSVCILEQTWKNDRIGSRLFYERSESPW